MILTLTNFKCYQNKTFVIPEKGTTKLDGNSGMGKSAIMSGIAFALYGKLSNSPITWGEKSCKVTLEYPSLKLQINRCKPNAKLIVNYNDKQYEDAAGQSIIESIFGLNQEEFQCSSYFNKDHSSILTMSPAEQLKFIESIISSTGGNTNNRNPIKDKEKITQRIKEIENERVEILSLIRVSTELLEKKKCELKNFKCNGVSRLSIKDAQKIYDETKHKISSLENLLKQKKESLKKLKEQDKEERKINEANKKIMIELEHYYKIRDDLGIIPNDKDVSDMQNELHSLKELLSNTEKYLNFSELQKEYEILEKDYIENNNSKINEMKKKLLSEEEVDEIKNKLLKSDEDKKNEELLNNEEQEKEVSMNSYNLIKKEILEKFKTSGPNPTPNLMQVGISSKGSTKTNPYGISSKEYTLLLKFLNKKLQELQDEKTELECDKKMKDKLYKCPCCGNGLYMKGDELVQAKNDINNIYIKNEVVNTWQNSTSSEEKNNIIQTQNGKIIEETLSQTKKIVTKGRPKRGQKGKNAEVSQEISQEISQNNNQNNIKENKEIPKVLECSSDINNSDNNSEASPIINTVDNNLLTLPENNTYIESQTKNQELLQQKSNQDYIISGLEFDEKINELSSQIEYIKSTILKLNDLIIIIDKKSLFKRKKQSELRIISDEEYLNLQSKLNLHYSVKDNFTEMLENGNVINKPVQLPKSLENMKKKIQIIKNEISKDFVYNNKLIPKEIQQKIKSLETQLKKILNNKGDYSKYTREIKNRENVLDQSTKKGLKSNTYSVNGKSNTIGISYKEGIPQNNEISQTQKDIDIIEKEIEKNQQEYYDTISQLHICQKDLNDSYEYQKHITIKEDIQEMTNNLSISLTKEKKISERLEALYIIEKDSRLSEFLAFEKVINDINTYTKIYLDEMFKDEPISANIVIKRHTKKGDLSSRPSINVKVSYRGHTSVPVHDLSDGQKQRCNLAFMLGINDMFGSKIVMLDECFNHIHGELNMELIEYVKELCKHKQVIIVAHESIDGVFDQVINL